MLYSQAKITALGSYVPNKILSNNDFSQMVDTSDEWIVRRTGMKERRIAEEHQYTSDLSIKAVENMLSVFTIEIDTVDMIIVATSTADFLFPSVASQVKDYFSIPNCGAMDLSAACAGFTYALNVANGFISTNQCNKVLVIGAETLSKIVDYEDRTTCVLFGDGAGAALVEKTEKHPSFLHAEHGTIGSAAQHLYVSSLTKQIKQRTIEKERVIVQNGKELFKLAVSTLTNRIPSFLQDANLTVNDIDWFVPHSANLRIIQAICSRTGIPEEKVLFSAEFYGNTSAASIPLSLTEAYQLGKLRDGNLVLLSGFGAGFVFSNVLLRWSGIY